MVTLKQIAHQANVSVRTVSVVLNGKAAEGRISSQLATRITRIANELNYRPNVIARATRTKKSCQVGLLVSELTNPYTGAMVEIIEKALAQRGYRMLLGLTNRDLKVGKDYLSEFSHGIVDGILNLDPYLGTEVFEKLHVSVPFIHFLRPSPRFRLTVDYAEGTWLALRHLRALGHRRIGFISGPKEDLSSQERRKAFQSFFVEHASRGLRGFIENGEWTFESGMELAPRLLENKCTAIFGANDLLAAGAIAAIYAAGLKVPHHVSVVGFDDSLLAKMCNPPLTSVHIPFAEAAEQSVEALISLILGKEAPPPRKYETLLTERGSTGKPPQKA